MISRISSANINFTSYRQRFTNEEFQQRVDESLVWAKENVDNSKYFKTKKQMNKKLENNAKGALNTLASYKQVFKKSDFEPHVELSLKEKELVGKVTHLNSTPIEVRTELPCNLKEFFESINKGAKAQVKEDILNQKLWEIVEKINYLEASINKRYKELTPQGEKEPNPFALFIDSVYNGFIERMTKLVKTRDNILFNLNELKPKLKSQQFKLKVK